MAKLQIALVTPCFGETGSGEADILARHLAQGFSERGHSVRVLTTDASEKDRYDATLFLSSLDGTTLHAAGLARAGVFFQPLLREDARASLPIVEHCIHAARNLLFASDVEYLLARRLYGPGIADKSHVTGYWIDPPPLDSPFPAFSPDGSVRYVLSVGQRDERKNTGLLIEAFREYREQAPALDLKLVLAGPGDASYDDPEGGVIDVGFVSEHDKHALLAHAAAVFQPSYRDDDSRVMLESWAHGRPVAVNSLCLPAALAVESSGGGWAASSKSEWASLFQEVARSGRDEISRIGAKGRSYYDSHATKAGVLSRYEQILGEAVELTKRTPFRGKITQVLLKDNPCDDRSRRAATFEALLDEAGFESRLSIGSALPVEADGPVVLHSFEPSAAWVDVADRVPVAVVYSQRHAMGDAGVSALVERAALILVDTPEYAEDVGSRAGGQVHLLTPFFGTSIWDVTPDPALIASLDDGVSNLIFIGPLSRATCCEQLLAAFSFLLSMQCDARLIVADAAASDHGSQLQQVADAHGLSRRFLLLPNAGVPQLAAVYRSASLFFSMSEAEEGICALFDAMLFDVPVLAYATPKVRYALGSAGLLFNDKSEPLRIGALAKILLRDAALRHSVLTAQRSRRQALGKASFDQLDFLARILR